MGSNLPAVLSRAWLGFCCAQRGAFTAGLARAEEGLRVARAVNHPFSLVEAYRGVALLHLLKGDLHQAIPALEQGLGICQDWHIPLLFPLIAMALGYAYAMAGRVAEALPLLEQGEELWTARRSRGGTGQWVIWMGAAYLLADRIDAANRFTRDIMHLCRERKQRGDEARSLWLLGDVAMRRAPADVGQAAAHYRQALILADELGTRPLQAHCHRGLGTLYATTGQREQAGVELSTATDLYRAMAMTFWLPQTEATLAQVEAR